MGAHRQCVPVFRQLVAEKGNGMTKDGAMEQIGSMSVGPYAA
jgi:hypothetical protein